MPHSEIGKLHFLAHDVVETLHAPSRIDLTVNHVSVKRLNTLYKISTRGRKLIIVYT